MPLQTLEFTPAGCSTCTEAENAEVYSGYDIIMVDKNNPRRAPAMSSKSTVLSLTGSNFTLVCTPALKNCECWSLLRLWHRQLSDNEKTCAYLHNVWLFRSWLSMMTWEWWILLRRKLRPKLALEFTPAWRIHIVFEFSNTWSFAFYCKSVRSFV